MASKDDVIEVHNTIEDPELLLDIWFLGLIYGIEIDGSQVKIDMTFTSPLCPMGLSIVEEIKTKVGGLEGISSVEVSVVFSPPWEPSEEVRAMLGLL